MAKTFENKPILLVSSAQYITFCNNIKKFMKTPVEVSLELDYNNYKTIIVITDKECDFDNVSGWEMIVPAKVNPISCSPMPSWIMAWAMKRILIDNYPLMFRDIFVITQDDEHFKISKQIEKRGDIFIKISLGYKSCNIDKKILSSINYNTHLAELFAKALGEGVGSLSFSKERLPTPSPKNKGHKDLLL